MKKKLTERFLQTVKAPIAGRLVIADTDARGLTFRMTPLGVRSFTVRYRLRGQAQRSYTVGSYPGISLAEARQRARTIVTAAKQGIDLIAEKHQLAAKRLKEAATSRSVRQLAAEYIDHIKHHLRRWRDVERSLNLHVFPLLGDRPASSIRRADIVELPDNMQARGIKQQLNRVRAALSTMFPSLSSGNMLTPIPLLGRNPAKSRSRGAESCRTMKFGQSGER
jgi:hypothetical protein